MNSVITPFPDDEPSDTSLARIKLSKDLFEMIATAHPMEVRYVVDAYYQRQDDRIARAGQMRAIDQRKDDGPKSHNLLGWMFDHEQALEHQLKLALGKFAKKHEIGRWMMDEIYGIGPVIAAGLICHIDLHNGHKVRGCMCGGESCAGHRITSVGHIWSYAGLAPGVTWNKGEKRPWNADLKVLAYKIGESFVKVQNKEGAFYGQKFAERKRLEIQKNDLGQNIQAAQAKNYDRSTEAWAWANGCYPAGICERMAPLDLQGRAQLLKTERLKPGEGQPMLAPAHVHARARRWVVKLFLSHLFEKWYGLEFGEAPPEIYAIAQQGHAHKIPVPAPRKAS